MTNEFFLSDISRRFSRQRNNAIAMVRVCVCVCAEVAVAGVESGGGRSPSDGGRDVTADAGDSDAARSNYADSQRTRLIPLTETITKIIHEISALQDD